MNEEDIINELMEGKYWISCILLVVMIIKVVVDYWNTTSLERIIMTDLEKFVGHISNLVFPSLILAVVSGSSTLLIEVETSGTNDENVYSKEQIAWGTFGVVLTFSIILNAILSWIGKVFSIKIEYYIELNDEKDWKIVRRSNKETLLIENKEEKTKFIDNWVDKDFYNELNEKSYMNKFYKSKKFKYSIEWILILSALVLFIATTVYINNLWSLVTFIIGAIFLVTFVLIVVNSRDYIKHS